MVVGKTPGVTMCVSGKVIIKEDPLTYLVYSLEVKSVETGLKLATCATLQDKTYG